MRVDIYITTKFQGKFSSGRGDYAILLDTVVNEKHYKKIHLAGWKGLSFQKMAARAAVEAIQCMTEPSDVVIHIDLPYALNVMKSGNAKGKAHEGLWSIYFDAAGRMESVDVKWDKDHKYRSRMLQQMVCGGYAVFEDRRTT